jgi:HSP20 family protein
MADEKKELRKQEARTEPGVERLHQRTVFVPEADIYETKDNIVLLVDMAGVDKKSVDITLEKNLMTIHGSVENEMVSGHRLAYSEYRVGDYQRSFTLSNEIDREKINATVKDGLLRLVLPKAETAKVRKISVTAA